MEWGEDLWANFSHGSTGSTLSADGSTEGSHAPAISKVEEIVQSMQEPGKGLDIRSRYSGLTLKKYADCFVGALSTAFYSRSSLANGRQARRRLTGWWTGSSSSRVTRR